MSGPAYDAAPVEALLDAAEAAQCACSVRERDSGHLVNCWMPALSAAIEAIKAADGEATK